MNLTLPESCIARHRTTGEYVHINRGERGYYETTVYDADDARELNRRLGATQEAVEAMYHGSLFGWDAPAADPGHPINQNAAKLARETGEALGL